MFYATFEMFGVFFLVVCITKLARLARRILASRVCTTT